MRRIKKVGFYLIPFLVVFIVAEGMVRLMRVPVIQDEPYFFGFFGCPKYFQKIRTEDYRLVYRTNPEKDIEQTEVPVRKDPNTYRVFVLGASVEYGEPFGPEGAFSHWLDERLRNYCPDHTLEVINCARKGFGSVRICNIFNEVIKYDPDLIILSIGGNEIRDYRFHRLEINIEIRPVLKMVKRFLDNSYIFRMFFHLFFKERITSFGAENIQDIAGQDGFDEQVFSKHVQSVYNSRRRLDAGHGGLWVTKLDPTHPTEDEDFGEVFKQLNGRNELPEKFTMIFELNVRHIVEKCRKKGVPVLFLTRVRNLYYNRDDRLLFDRFDAANGVLRKVCTEKSIPLVETLSALLRSLHDEIGYNAFIDDVHPTMSAHQIMAKEIVAKMLEERLIDPPEGITAELEKAVAFKEEKARVEFPFRSEYYALMGWQKLVMMEASDDPKRTQEEIVALANRALEIEPDAYHNYLTYILLGTLYSMTGDAEKAKDVWKTMKEKYSGWR